MKKVIVLLLSLILTCSSVQALEYGQEWKGYEDGASSTYKDVTPAHWAYNAIQRVSATNWFSGYPDGTFRPGSSITREEAMKVIVVFLGLDLKKTDVSTYFDVKADRWSSPYIEAGKMLFPKIETYNGQMPFQPEMPIKREDVMYALVIAKKYNNEVTFVDQSVLNMFKDANSISADLKPYVALAVNIGLVSGHSNGTIGAQDPLTRAEFATLLYRATFIGDGTGGGLSDVATVRNVELGLPLVNEMTVGETLTITAAATMSDGTTTDYSENLNPYNSSNNNVVLMNRNQIQAVAPGTAVIKFNADPLLADKNIVINVKAAEQPQQPAEEPEQEPEEPEQSEEEPEEEPDEDGAYLVSLEWSVEELSLNKGDTARIKLFGNYSDGSQKDVTREYTLKPNDTSVVTVDRDGNVKAVGTGEAKITFSLGDIAEVMVARPLKVTVASANKNDIVKMKWSEESVEVAAGEKVRVKLLGVFADGSTIDITEDCGVFSDDDSIAVFENGYVKGVSAGKTDLWFESAPNAKTALPDMLSVIVE